MSSSGARQSRERIGNPDLLILFTHTVSHKMIQCVLASVGGDTRIRFRKAVRRNSHALSNFQPYGFFTRYTYPFRRFETVPVFFRFR